MQTCFRRSELALRGPRHGLIIGTSGARGVRSAPLFALIPSPTATRAVVEVPRGFRALLRGF
eukprot:2150320-Alexandrium_andersonii.AAC.1